MDKVEMNMIISSLFQHMVEEWKLYIFKMRRNYDEE